MKGLVTFAFFTSMAGAVASAPVDTKATQNAAVYEQATDTVRLKVEGMTCGGCAISARLVLQRLDGVKKAEVDYDTKVAVVHYDAAKVSPQQMIEALKTKLKYTATFIKKEEQ
jgi:copper chaperone CopZ